MKVLWIVVILSLFLSCKNEKKEIRIYCAGSLAKLFEELADEFQKENPDIIFKIEPSGSVDAIRKIIELKKNPDIVAVSDYILIAKYLVPEYVENNKIFAGNSIVIAYNKNSKYSKEITSDNWHEIILRDDVIIGRSEPNSDPCGYRTLFVFNLSSKYYNNMLEYKLINKNKTVIRPKEVDLIALLENGNIDYLFIYKSLAQQHNTNMILLPDEINLSNPEYNEFYKQACVKLNDDRNSMICGASILYSVAVMKKSANKEIAEAFEKFIIESKKAKDIILKNGFIIYNNNK